MIQIDKKYSRQQALRNAERQEEQEARSKAQLEDHHIISESRNMPISLFEFVRKNSNSLAIRVLCNSPAYLGANECWIRFYSQVARLHT